MGKTMKNDLKRDCKTFVYTNPCRLGTSYRVWLTPITTRRDCDAWLVQISPLSGGKDAVFVRYGRGQYYHVTGSGIAPVSIKKYYPHFSLAGVI